MRSKTQHPSVFICTVMVKASLTARALFDAFNTSVLRLQNIIDKSCILDAYVEMARKCREHSLYYLIKYFSYASFLVMECELLLHGTAELAAQRKSHSLYLEKDKYGSYTEHFKDGSEKATIFLSRCSVAGFEHWKTLDTKVGRKL